MQTVATNLDTHVSRFIAKIFFRTEGYSSIKYNGTSSTHKYLKFKTRFDQTFKILTSLSNA